MLRGRVRRHDAFGASGSCERLPRLMLLNCFLRLLWLGECPCLLRRRSDEFLVSGQNVALYIYITQRLRHLSTVSSLPWSIPAAYLPYLRHVLGLVIQLLDYSIEPGRDLPSNRQPRPSTPSVERASLTSVAALSDCTSHSLSNCSTRASGSTNHCIIWTSLMPVHNQRVLLKSEK